MYVHNLLRLLAIGTDNPTTKSHSSDTPTGHDQLPARLHFSVCAVAVHAHLYRDKVVHVGACLRMLAHSEHAHISSRVQQVSNLIVIYLDELHRKTDA